MYPSSPTAATRQPPATMYDVSISVVAVADAAHTGFLYRRN